MSDLSLYSMKNKCAVNSQVVKLKSCRANLFLVVSFVAL